MLTFGFGGFTGLVKEGDIEPVGVVAITNPSRKTMTLLNTSGPWSANTGNFAKGPIVFVPQSKKYLQHDADGNVQAFLDEPQDPPYTTSDLNPTLTLKFPSIVGNDVPDEKLAEGTSLTVTVRADNAAGSAGPANDKVTPTRTTTTEPDA